MNNHWVAVPRKHRFRVFTRAKCEGGPLKKGYVNLLSKPTVISLTGLRFAYCMGHQDFNYFDDDWNDQVQVLHRKYPSLNPSRKVMLKWGEKCVFFLQLVTGELKRKERKKYARSMRDEQYKAKEKNYQFEKSAPVEPECQRARCGACSLATPLSEEKHFLKQTSARGLSKWSRLLNRLILKSLLCVIFML